MDDVDCRYICHLCCHTRQNGRGVGLLRDMATSHATDMQCRPASTEINPCVCRVFHFDKMRSSKWWMPDGSFIAKLSSNCRLDGKMKLQGIFAMPSHIPDAPVPAVRPILEIALQVATAFLMTLAAALVLLGIEVNIGSPTGANLLF